ncbi:MAG: hypothetical protein CL846_07995 [Crocinitomicaceae bacterium]|nr:hypothetical protein [Crocinitomicaceae bacterium]
MNKIILLNIFLIISVFSNGQSFKDIYTKTIGYRIDSSITTYNKTKEDIRIINNWSEKNKNCISIVLSSNKKGIQFKYEYNLDDSGFILNRLKYRYKEDLKKLDYHSRHIYIYDEKNNLLSKTRYKLNSNLEEIPWVKYEYRYNENNNKTLFLKHEWDDNLNKWKFVQREYGGDKISYKYNENGKIKLRLHYNWDTISMKFVPISKYKYIYIDSNRLKKVISSHLNPYNKELRDTSYIDEFIYDKNGNKLFEINYSRGIKYSLFPNDTHPPEQKILLPRKKIEFKYDNNNNLLSKKNYVWVNNLKKHIIDSNNVQNSPWIELKYNDEGILISKFEFEFEKFSESWYIKTKIIRKIIKESKDNISFLTTYYDYDSNYNKYVVDKYVFDYFSKVGGFNSRKNLEFN